VVYQWPVGSPLGQYLRERMWRQAQRFRIKFGREPGSEDPVFLIPTLMNPALLIPTWQVAKMIEGLRRVGRGSGVDPALVEAWCELGYVVTEDTRYLFSVGDIAAWDEAVRRRAGDLDGGDRLRRRGIEQQRA
jgi:hypothetical protein